MRTLLLLAVIAGSPDAGVGPGDWKTNPNLNFTQAAEKCRLELPQCKVPWAEFDAPPHPCANRGAACPPELRNPIDFAGVWRCGCDECATDSDCAARQRCRVQGPVNPCSHKHVTRRCVLEPDGGMGPDPLMAPCMSMPPSRAP